METGAEVSLGQLPEVPADRTQLVSLSQNLIGSVLKYRPSGSGAESRSHG